MSVQAILDILSKVTDKKGLLACFEAMPPEDGRDFETVVTRAVESHPECVEYCREILDDPGIDKRLRYTAFFTLSTYYRRYRDATSFYRLLVRMQQEFQGFATYNHLYVMYLKMRRQPGDLRAAIDFAQKAMNGSQQHVGILHNFAEAVVSAIEEEDVPLDKDLLERAKHALGKAIAIDSAYAKFYCTKGRIAAVEQAFPEAKRLIREAIDLEDSRKRDYSLRLTDYQSHLLRVQLRESSLTLRQEFSAGLQKINDSYREIDRYAREERVKNLEFLGFFAAIISLIIGSIQLTQQRAVGDAAQLIAFLVGALVIAFAGLSFVLYGTEKIGRSLWMLLVGAGASGLGLAGVPFILRVVAGN